MKKTNKKGFTIVELVIVIAVIAILAGVLIPTFSNVVKKANESKAIQAARNAYTEVMAYSNASPAASYTFKASATEELLAIYNETGVQSATFTVENGVVTGATFNVNASTGKHYVVTYDADATTPWTCGNEVAD